MKYLNIQSYLEKNYLDYIITQKQEPYHKTSIEIAQSLREIDHSLNVGHNDTLRKAIARIYKFHQTKQLILLEARREEKREELGSPDNRLTQYIEKHDLPDKNMVQAKFVNHNGQEKFNITYDFTSDKARNLAQDTVEAVLAKLLKENNIEPIKPRKNSVQTTDRVRYIFTDAHIGMEPNENGKGLYGGIWNKDELFSRLKIMLDDMITDSKEFVNLDIMDLGDFIDGWNGTTTRGGHSLSQNMTNEEMFAVGVEAKIYLLDHASKFYKNVTMYNVCNDNHAGSFGYIVNHAVAEIAKVKYNNVKVHNKTKFINHYATDTHAWVYMHGKDEELLKQGFPLVKDAKAAGKIEDYLKAHNLFGRGLDITIEKGDLHQALLDWSCEDYDYNTYPALSPSSNYIQTGFRKGKSGYVRQTVVGNKKDTVIRWFKWNNYDIN